MAILAKNMYQNRATKKGEINSGILLTEPSKSLTIAELIENHTRGTGWSPINQLKEDAEGTPQLLPEEFGFQLNDVFFMDKAERAQKAIDLKNLQKRLDEDVKIRKAEINDLQKRIKNAKFVEDRKQITKDDIKKINPESE